MICVGRAVERGEPTLVAVEIKRKRHARQAPRKRAPGETQTLDLLLGTGLARPNRLQGQDPFSYEQPGRLHGCGARPFGQVSASPCATISVGPLYGLEFAPP
jgi:hypothetical protein